MPDHPLYPLKLQATYHETIWGGRNLARLLGKPLPAEGNFGESWETAPDSIIVNGIYQNKKLDDIVIELGANLLGPTVSARFPDRFPLLIKFIDAHDQLSVQAHPDDRYARVHEGGKLGKTEAWFILHADPGAHLIHGFNGRYTAQEIRLAITSGKLEEYLNRSEVHAGDVVFVPAGTIHAIGTGIVLYEIQEQSDITYRLYDYNRLGTDGKPRQLHIDKGLEVLNYEPLSFHTVEPIQVQQGRRALIACPYFVLLEETIPSPLSGATTTTSCEIITLLEGKAQLSANQASVLLSEGDTVVLPALMGKYSLETSGCRWLRAYIPQATDPILGHFSRYQKQQPDR